MMIRPRMSRKRGFKASPSYTLRLCVLILALLTSISCSDGLSTDYKFMDSGVWTIGSGLAGVFWLDNNRVLLLSKENLVPDRNSRDRYAIWDTSTGSVTLTGPFHHVECVRDGKAFYTTWDNEAGRSVYHFGTPGDAPEYPPPNADMRVDSRFDCDWVPKKVAYPGGWGKDVAYRYKLKGENYIEVLEPQVIDHEVGPDKKLYHQRKNDKGTAFPPEFVLGAIRYNPFIDAYYIRGYAHANPRGYWTIERNGLVRNESFPGDMPDNSKVHDIYPFRNGYLVHILEWADWTNAGESGLYVMSSGRYLRLIGGIVGSVSVSPDGCKAAFEHAKNHNEDKSSKRPFRTLKMINLCK